MKTTQHKHVPVLRFPEFNGEWKRRRLGNVIRSYRLGGNYVNTEIETKYPLIKMGNLGRGKINLEKIEYIRQGEKIYEDDLIKPGDLFFNTRNTLDLVGKVAIWRGELKIAYYNSNLMRIMFDNNFFMNDQLNSPRGIKDLRRMATGTTSVAAIYNKDLLKVWLFIPQIEEQQKIAAFLSSVDTKIEQLTKKKTLWKQYKKGMMQKLFSQEIRFKDEQGDNYPGWEEKQLDDIAKFSKGKGISKSDTVSNGIVKCILYGQLYTYYGETISNVISSTNIPNAELVFSKKNDVIIPASGETALDIASAACVCVDGVALGGDINIIRCQQNGIFLAYYLNNKRNDIARLAQGKSVIHLYGTHLKSLKLRIPSKKEQQKIATFLSAIDQKIELVDTEIKQAQAFKKGCSSRCLSSFKATDCMTTQSEQTLEHNLIAQLETLGL